MPAGFPSLRYDDVGAGGNGGPSFVGGTDRDEDDCVRFARLADDAAGVAPEERDDAYTRCERRREPFALIPCEAEVDTEWLLGLLPRLIDDRGDVLRGCP